MADETARAFVPGHVTGFFSVHRHADPARAGSRGAGVALSDGVTTSLSPADSTRVVVAGELVEFAAVEGVLDALGVTARVECESDVEVGSGFGASGAAALGTAYAANALFGLSHTENELVRLAHVAEVEAGTGLGDVVAQAHGGVPIRLDPGAPPHGRLDRIPTPSDVRVEYLTFGELSTEGVLDGDTDALSAAGESALDALCERPTLEGLVGLSSRFAAETGLLTDDLRAVVEDVEAAGGLASMAMLGRTVFALGTGLSDAGYDACPCRVHAAGATLLG